MTRELRIGSRLPGAMLGRLDGNRVRRVPLHRLCRGRSVVIAGVPGAFTPSCSRHHIPGFVAQADRLKQAGVDRIVCLAPNDPWSLTAWAQRLDPGSKLLFLSDGNGEFAEGSGLALNDREHFLGRTLRRFVLMAVDGVAQRLEVEQNIIDLTCTRAEDLLDAVNGLAPSGSRAA